MTGKLYFFEITYRPYGISEELTMTTSTAGDSEDSARRDVLNQFYREVDPDRSSKVVSVQGVNPPK